MPLPTLLCVALASGAAAALAGRAELRVTPRPALLTRAFGAFVVFAGLVLVPISVYFYVFHGDWFLLYLVDVRKVPSAVALLGFLLEVGTGAIGFAIGAVLVRGQRDTLAVILSGAALVASVAVVPLGIDRLSVVGSFAQYEGGYGLSPYFGGAELTDSPVFLGTIAMSLLLFLALGHLLLRLRVAGRRGG